METKQSDAGRKASWGKRIAIFLGGLAVVLVAAYFVLTSSAFIKAVVLPKAGAALNAKITAQEVSLSPFSQIQLTGLRVETTGSEPLLTAQQVRVRYGLIDILKGQIKVDEVTLQTPVVNVVRQPDGKSNLDPLLEGPSKEEAKSEKAAQISIRNVSLKNGTIRQVELLKDGGKNTAELTGLEITLDRLGNNQSGKLALNSALALTQQSPGSNDVLRGTISGGYEISLNEDLLPKTVTGSSKLAVTSVEGAYADLAGFNGSFEADLTPKEIKRIALVFGRNNQRLGEVRVSGPLDLERKEGNLRLEILSLDRNVFALLAAGEGLDFRQTEVNSTNQITISQAGTFFAASGNLKAANVSIAKGETVTPVTDLNLDYQATVNTADQTAVLQKLNLSGVHSGRPFLRTELDRQMNLSWGETVKGYKDAALHLTLTNLSLAEWRAVLGTNIESGVLNAQVSIVAQQDGKKLIAQTAVRLADFAGTFATNRVQKIDFALDALASIDQLKAFDLSRYSFAVAEAGANILQGEGAARYDSEKKDASGQLSARGELPRLLAFAALTNVAARAGKLEITATCSESSGKRKAMGTVAVKNFTGSYDAYPFESYQAAVDFNVELDPRYLDLNRVSASFSQGYNAGGTIDLKGRYDLETKAGQFSFNTVELNQNALRPMLAPSLGGNQLVSITVNGSGEASLDPKGGNAVKANVKVANWVVKDPAGTLPQTPLAAELGLNAGLRETQIDLREFALKLSPTARAKNELRIQGKLDLAATNASPSTLAIRAESLDLTPYYNMFSGGTNAAAAPSATPAAASNEEPAPMQLPFQQLAADLKIDQLYLRDLAISNWTGQVTIRTNVLQVQPFQMRVNGGDLSLTAKIDTGIAGYRYEVGFQAGSVPLLPLANTFGSGPTNQLEGLLVADARIAGAGITGPNIRKNLAGQASVNLTNLNYHLVGPKLQRIIVPISLALRLPELTQTPVNWVSIQTEIGKGVVQLEKLAVESEAFHAVSAGPIVLADVLSNSVLNLPLDLSLRRSLAEKTHLIAANTPTNAKYAPLPRFVSIEGTVGAPEVDINKLALAGMLARGAAGFGLGNERAEQALGAIGGLLTGQPSGAGGTNAPSTNASPAAGLLQGLGGLLGGGRPGNAAPDTNAPATNASPAAGLFKSLGGLLGGPKPATNPPARK